MVGKIKSTIGGVASSLPHPFVSAQEYPELAKAAVRANGGNGFVVERNPRSEQWRAWIAYFSRMEWEAFDKQGHPYVVNRGKVYEGMQKITVPTEWPLEFDDSAPPARPLTQDDMPIGPARRREVAAMMHALADKLGSWDRPGAPTWRGHDARGALDARTAPTPELRAQAVAYHETRLAELAKAYAAEDRSQDASPSHTDTR